MHVICKQDAARSWLNYEGQWTDNLFQAAKFHDSNEAVQIVHKLNEGKEKTVAATEHVTMAAIRYNGFNKVGEDYP
jgi:hypothetical protein